MNLRTSLSAKHWPAIGRYSNAIVGTLIVAAGLLVLVALWQRWIDILPYKSKVAGQQPADEVQAAPTTVILTPEKLAAAEVRLATVQRKPIQPTREVPGELTYDESKRVPITAPVSGVVLQVLAEPGQQVAKDQPLAVLSSRQVGEARDEVEKRKADLELAGREEERRSRISANVDGLLALLDQHPDPEAVEKALGDKPLGDYRRKIVSAYSALVLAERRMRDTTEVGGVGLSARIIETRKNERETADAEYKTARDNARFDALQERVKATAVREQAERLLSVAEQNLKNLLGPLADMRAVTDPEHLSELTLLAPFAGTVQERQAVKAALVQAGGPLFTLADTSELWLSAAIHERDWRALDVVHPGDELKLHIYALQGEPLAAKIRWIGPQLNDVTRSVPLVADLKNADGRLKPGMFIWAIIPLAKPHEGLLVPAGAISRHENQPFVFVPDGERKFRRVDVQLGLETNEWIEIASGLKEGEEVVDQGAFYLKSELLLEREE